jgi:hypothetical protein
LEIVQGGKADELSAAGISTAMPGEHESRWKPPRSIVRLLAEPQLNLLQSSRFEIELCVVAQS